MQRCRNSLSIIASLCILFTSCTNANNEKECSKPLNPNGDSELALLMRNMYKHLETERSRIKTGKGHGIYPENFKKIRTAKPSSRESIGVDFDEFALLYLSALQHYHQSDSVQAVIGNYNNLVNSCINCHNQECPGPVKKIEKMLIR